jgi:hypothetical protein
LWDALEAFYFFFMINSLIPGPGRRALFQGDKIKFQARNFDLIPEVTLFRSSRTAGGR